MNKFMNTLSNTTTTTNGAGAVRNLQTPLHTLLAQGGASDDMSEVAFKEMLIRAITFDAEATLKLILYFSDIREGQGRRLFLKRSMTILSEHNYKLNNKLIPMLPEIARWDYVLFAFNTKSKRVVSKLIKEQFSKDMEALANDEPVSLLGKWLPTMSGKDKQLAKQLCSALNIPEDIYNGALPMLRQKINIVETKLAQGDRGTINFKEVPKKALMKYKKTFSEHEKTSDKYTRYLDDLISGVETHTTMAYPHEIVGMGCSRYTERITDNKKEVIAHWSGLNNYIGDNQVIVVADTSGSMSGTPMLVSKSLAVYCAERLTGSFKDTFITFSDKPIIQKLQGDNVVDKYNNMKSIVANTNIESTFDLLLNVAVNTKEVIPDVLIISDMQFDRATTWNIGEVQLFDSIERKFAQHGVDMPRCVFWNVNATTPAFQMKEYITHVSGYSPQLLEIALGKDPLTEILDNPRYELGGTK